MKKKDTELPNMLNMTTWFYKNCRRQRKGEAKICQVCPFRKWIELQEDLVKVGKGKYE